jgi:hypothetical protein
MARLVCAILLLIAAVTTLAACAPHDSLADEIYVPGKHLDPGSQ